MIPGDLKRFEKGADLPKTGEPGTVQPKTPKTKAKPKVQKPVSDYELPTIRCKYASQGKNAPIIKIECKEDRFDLNSRWRQKTQITIKDDITPEIAANVARTFADCYQHMSLNPRLLDFKECRTALLAYNEHDWSKKPLSWEFISELCLKGFRSK